MSYQERRTIVSIITGILVIAAYCIYAFGRYQSGAVDANDLEFWARTMLIFIGIGIAFTIVIMIVFHIFMSIGIAVQKKILDEQYDDKAIEKSIDAAMVEDEMDKLIELKSMRIGFAIAGIGFIAGLVSLVVGYSAAVMLNILFLSFSVGTILEGFAQLYFYRRGVTNG
jgi:uncharacterized BrkB/YihY/UPF0761 family membrane protein